MTDNARSLLALLLSVPDGARLGPKDAGMHLDVFEAAALELEAGVHAEFHKTDDPMNPKVELVVGGPTIRGVGIEFLPAEAVTG